MDAMRILDDMQTLLGEPSFREMFEDENWPDRHRPDKSHLDFLTHNYPKYHSRPSLRRLHDIWSAQIM